MRREGSFRKTVQQLLDGSIHAGRSLIGCHDGALSAYERLLWRVQSQTTLLRPSGRAGDNRSMLNAGLVALALHHADWLRSVETWRPQQKSAWRQVHSLAYHLLACYPVPAFMTSVWFDLPPGVVLPQHGWYKHLGVGDGIHTAGLPLRFTRGMAHLFGQAPHHYSVIAALRWAQVRGLGGKEPLARAVIGTRLGRMLENEDFWESVLLFFVNQPTRDVAQVGPIMEFLQYQKFEEQDHVFSDGVVGKLPPPCPDYSLKGRSVATVLRQVGQWHQQIGQPVRPYDLRWRHSPIQDFWLSEGSERLGARRVWTITELLTGRDLLLEGRAMRHCVSTYTSRCARRQTSIWSMRVENQSSRDRVLTIEVDLATRTICQVRGRCNQMPQAREQEVLKQWATEQGLKVGELIGV
jgi:PcfJ-like protein